MSTPDSDLNGARQWLNHFPEELGRDDRPQEYLERRERWRATRQAVDDLTVQGYQCLGPAGVAIPGIIYDPGWIERLPDGRFYTIVGPPVWDLASDDLSIVEDLLFEQYAQTYFEEP